MTDQIQRMKVLGAGIFSLILALGVARFSYTPLLPLMQQQAGLGLAEGGWLAAINYGGYLTGALVAASIIEPGLYFAMNTPPAGLGIRLAGPDSAH